MSYKVDWIKFIFSILMVVYVSTGAAVELTQNPRTAIPIIVLDIELLGDTSVESMQQGDSELMAKFSKSLRQQLNQQHGFTVLDDPHSLAVINKQSEHHYLHRCNGCELNIAKKLGAKHVVVPWIFRMSKLIQTMYIEVRDVETGKVLVHEGRNFRGNTEDGWQHVIDQLVESINQNT
ncbi:hypothetical protein LCGC14_0625230 [marine sediment metagenome]|uniref:DUF2380 domain-containing protein n=1 Tax=marine sediment metagenome TaxID=412755 RepID=A0A0F9UC20_9ZZZZ|nr:DUF2380 domain-containing protein [Methylophaga sp.]